MNEAAWIPAEWPAPAWIRAGTTSRQGGCSAPPYASFNLASHVGDQPESVRQNRDRLRALLRLPDEPCWLEQYHGNRVIDLQSDPSARRADGARTDRRDQVCAILTADCLPVCLCNRSGTEVAALHAGWRGLAGGIIAAGVAAMHSPPGELLAWLGPAIGSAHYEVDGLVRAAFEAQLPQADQVFHATRPGHWQLDLYAAARQLLELAGVHSIFAGAHCTFAESGRFYSFRRDGETGRMASLIWIAGQRSFD